MLRNEPRTHRRLNQNCAARAVQRKRSKFCTHLAGHILTYHLSVRTTYKLNSTDDVVVVGLIYRKRIRSVLLRSRRYDRAAMINIGCVCFPPVCLHLSRGRNERLVPHIQTQGASPDWTIPAEKSISSSLGTISALPSVLRLLSTFSAEEIRHFSTF